LTVDELPDSEGDDFLGFSNEEASTYDISKLVFSKALKMSKIKSFMIG
jgi:hypothetical protein